MAEGGDEKDKNPYSFQHFIKAGTSKPQKKDQESSDELEVDLISDSDLGSARKRDNNRTVPEEDGRTQRREENPFSFKQFLSRDGTGGARPKTRSQTSSLDGFPDHYASDVQRRQTAPDVASSSLPDFVQDHFFIEPSLRHGGGRLAEVPENMPDFTLNGHISTLQSNQPTWQDNSQSSPTVRDPLDIKSSLNKNGLCENTVASALPDFLSDGPMLSNHNNHDALNHSSRSSRENVSLNGEVGTSQNEIVTENQSLQRQLQESNRLLSVSNRRIAELERELSSVRSKEVEDNASLEKMVQQVETNLQLATQRAVTAESQVTKLRQELKSLQTVVDLVMAENSTIKMSDGNVFAIREKARTASEQITTAATSAEQKLKQLLLGVESLKMVASFLDDIDKVTETSPDQDPDQASCSRS